MNKTKRYLTIALLPLSSAVFAQQNDATQLDELIIEHQKISNQSKSQRTIVLNDSLINHNTGTFTEFLQKNTSIHFRENGYGMVSSPSFRGTTAQQTSVLWNGIKINSALLGQTDFNSTAFKSYDNIVIKPGGGSVLYGSGAVGGTIHMNNDPIFEKPVEHHLEMNYGSFNTQGIHYKISGGSQKWAVNAHFGYNKSDNDFEWLGYNRKNSNGQFFNVNFGTELAYKINSKNTLNFYSSAYNDDRHFALITPYQTKTKYQNHYNRNLLKWHYKSHRFLNTFSVANIQEFYTYFDQLPTDSRSGGKANMWLFKNESYYNLTSQLKLSALLEYQSTEGEGTNSGLLFSTQEIASLSILANYDFSKNNGIEIGLKNEIAKDYQNPFLFSAGYYLNKKHYQLKINTSKNYRIPTFNDLYWQPGGNLDMKPETSYQVDINNGFVSKYFNANISMYYISISDMIRWIPTNTGFWEANNVDDVSVYGAEISLQTEKKWQHQSVQASVNYAYTKSINNETKKQLIYIPLHKFTAQLSYHYKNFSVIPSFLYTGKVYTTASNENSSAIDAYGVADMDFRHYFNIEKFPFTLGFRIKNIANTAYTAMPGQMMPGRNFHIQFIKKF